MKKLLLAGLLWSAWLSAPGQNDDGDPGKGHFGLQAGWGQTLIGDQHASPLLYHADAVYFGGIYRKERQTLFEMSLSFQVGSNQASRFGRRTATLTYTPDIYGIADSDEVTVNPFLSFIAGDLQLKWLWGLAEHHALGFSLNARHIYTGMALDDWHYTQVDISPQYCYRRSVLRGDAFLSFSLPLLAGVVRPNYAFDPSLPDESNYYFGYLRTSSRITSLNDLVNLRLGIGYTWHFQNGKDLGLQLGLTWTSYPYPRPVRIFENRLGVTYLF